MSVLGVNRSSNAGSSAYSSGRYMYMLPRIEIVPRLCLSTFGFHVVINKQSSRFFKLPYIGPVGANQKG
jgi:hypothetical protein